MIDVFERIQASSRRHPRLAVKLLLSLEQRAEQENKHEQQLHALIARFFILERLGDADQMLDDLNNGIFFAETYHLPHYAGRILMALGRIHYAQGKYRDAASFWTRCIDHCRFTKDAEALAEARIGLGQIYDAMGDWETGIRFHRDAGEILQSLNNPYLNAKQAINLAANHLNIGDIANAKRLFVFAMGEAERGGVQEYRAECHWHLSEIAIQENKLDLAHQEVLIALGIATDVHYKWLQGAARDTLAKILAKQGKIDEAIVVYQEALTFAQQLNSLAQKANVCDALSHLFERKSDLDNALYYSRLHRDHMARLTKMAASDQFRELREYDLSRKAPSELLLDLEANTLLNTGGFDQAIRTIANTALTILRVEYACVWLMQNDSTELVCHTIFASSASLFEPGSRLDAKHFPLYWKELTSTRGPIIVHDVRLHPAAVELSEFASAIDLHSLLEIPIRLNAVQVGVLSFGQCKKQRNWTRDDVLYGNHLSNTIVHAISTARHLEEQKWLEQRVEDRTREVIEQSQQLKSAYRDLLYKDKTLNERVSYNQTILDNLIDGIITLDAIGNIRSFNIAAMNIFGYTLDEIIGQNVNLLMPEPLRQRHTRYMDDAAVSGEVKIIGIPREVMGQRKDGSQFPMEIAVSKSSDHDQLIFIGIIRDISERKRLDRLKSEFISTVSHELRTPLTSIHGSLRLLESGVVGSLPAGANKLIELAQKNSQRLILLINDLLDIEKLASGKMVLNISPVDVVAIVKQSMRDNTGYALNYQVRYVLGNHPSKLLVAADAARLAQVLANLLSNAAKFSGDSLQVELRIIKGEAYATIEVEDHGHGIPIEFQQEMFKAFAQANNGDNRQQGGTGLRLKISKSLIEAMAGRISYETVINQGTIFRFTLPLAIDYVIPSDNT